MDLKQLTNALAGSITNAPNYGVNVNDTAANVPEMAAIRAVGALGAQGDAARRAMDATGVVANENTRQQDQAAAAAKKLAEKKKAEEINELEKKKAALEDVPDNYQAIVNDAGGYDFYNPGGEPISAVEYARKTNQRVTDVLKDSEDVYDKDFVQDYENVYRLGQIISSNDKDARDEFFKKNPEMKELQDMPYEEVVSNLRELYPEYFRGRELSRPGREEDRASYVGNSSDRSLQRRVMDALPFGSSRGFSQDSQVNRGF